MKIFDSIAQLAIAVSLGTFGSQALATCTILEGSIDRILSPITIPPLDSRTPVNGVLATINSTAKGTYTKIQCNSVPLQASFDSDFNYLDNQLYATGLTGISIRINPSGAGNMPSVITAFGDTWSIQPSQTVRIEFIKTGPIIEAGTIAPRVIARATSVSETDSTLMVIHMDAPWQLTLLRPTCEVTTPNITVDLGQISMADFDATGQTRPIDFGINLDCIGGTDTTNVHVTLTDANNPSNTTSQLSLAPGSEAQGIALEVNNRNGLVTFSPDLSGIGNPGQWLDGAAAAGNYSIPLSVNYVRLPGPIKGGTANSGVTYTLNYD